MYRFPGLILAFLFTLSASAQFKIDQMMTDVLSGNKDPNFREIISHPDKYRVQIIYTEINRDKQNVPHFTHHYFHYSPDYYFNPASMVKMPLAFLSLEKLNQRRLSLTAVAPGSIRFIPILPHAAVIHLLPILLKEPS